MGNRQARHLYDAQNRLNKYSPYFSLHPSIKRPTALTTCDVNKKHTTIIKLPTFGMEISKGVEKTEQKATEWCLCNCKL